MHFTASEWVSIITAIASGIVYVRHNWRISKLEDHTGIKKAKSKNGPRN